MSTRSRINVLCSDGKVKSIYCHFDGADHLDTLNMHYATLELAEQLVSQGNLSVLGSMAMDPPVWHTFNDPAEYYCVYYGRDRGDEKSGPKVYDDYFEARDFGIDIEYIYEFTDGGWIQYKR